MAAPGARMAVAPGSRIMRVRTGGGTAFRVVPGAPRTGGLRPVPRTNNFTNFTPGFGGGFGATSFNNVPGLGFDYPHLAAVDAGRGFGRGRGFFRGVPFFDGGFLWGGGGYLDQSDFLDAQPDPGNAVAANGAPSDPLGQPEPRSRYYEQAPSPAPAVQQQPAPVRDVEQYVFVKRDGGLEFAVAYSWVDGSLRYITPEGKRRTISRDALDLNATEQFNEQRGVEFHAPA
jgi:hypothetical protein